MKKEYRTEKAQGKLKSHSIMWKRRLLDPAKWVKPLTLWHFVVIYKVHFEISIVDFSKKWKKWNFTIFSKACDFVLSPIYNCLCPHEAHRHWVGLAWQWCVGIFYKSNSKGEAIEWTTLGLGGSRGQELEYDLYWKYRCQRNAKGCLASQTGMCILELYR